MQAQIAASLRHLKEAAAHLSEAARAIGEADKFAAANIGPASAGCARWRSGTLKN